MQPKVESKAEPIAAPIAAPNGTPTAAPIAAPNGAANGAAHGAANGAANGAARGAVNGARKAEPKTVVFRKPGDRVSESYFDSLAATVHEHVHRGTRTLMLTSAGSGEGKSTITAGLGRALARSGRHSVCIIDTDRYRPTLHTLFGLENKRGLGELLKELYHLDIGRETPGQFGIGDWLEISTRRTSRASWWSPTATRSSG
jgi:Mrp family chromosome partitioning ATPase